MTTEQTASNFSDSAPLTESEERRRSGWDIRNAKRNYVSLLAFQAGSAFFAFACTYLVFHRLGEESQGILVAVIAVSQVAQILANWSGLAVVRFGIDEFIDTQRIARSFWIRAIFLVVNLALVVAISGLWFPPIAERMTLAPEAYWLVIGHLTTTVIWLQVQGGFQAVKLTRLNGFMQMVERGLIFSGLVTMLSYGVLNTQRAIMCYIAVPGLMSVIGCVALRNYIFARFSVDREFLRKLTAYTLPLIPVYAVGYLSGNYLDTIFVSMYMSKSELGIYSIATQINGISLQLPTLANLILTPLFITLNKEEMDERSRHLFRDLLPSLTLFWGAICTAAAAAACIFIPLIFKPEAKDAILPLWILLASSTTALPVFIGYSAVVQAKSATMILMAASLTGAIANVLFNYLLIPYYGTRGCAWATVISCFIGTVTFGVLLKKGHHIPLSWVFTAMVPSVAGAGLFTQTGNMPISLAATLGLTVVTMFFQKSSIRAAFELAKNVRAVSTV